MLAAERHSSRVPEITITVAKDVPAEESISTQRTRPIKPVRSHVGKTVQLQFKSYEPPRTEKLQQGRQQLTTREPKRRTAKHHSHQPLAMIGKSKTATPQKPFPALERAIAGTASPLYMAIDPEVSAFQSLITYCKYTTQREGGHAHHTNQTRLALPLPCSPSASMYLSSSIQSRQSGCPQQSPTRSSSTPSCSHQHCISGLPLKPMASATQMVL